MNSATNAAVYLVDADSGLLLASSLEPNDGYVAASYVAGVDRRGDVDDWANNSIAATDSHRTMIRNSAKELLRAKYAWGYAGGLKTTTTTTAAAAAAAASTDDGGDDGGDDGENDGETDGDDGASGAAPNDGGDGWPYVVGDDWP